MPSVEGLNEPARLTTREGSMQAILVGRTTHATDRPAADGSSTGMSRAVTPRFAVVIMRTQRSPVRSISETLTTTAGRLFSDNRSEYGNGTTTTVPAA